MPCFGKVVPSLPLFSSSKSKALESAAKKREREAAAAVDPEEPDPAAGKVTRQRRIKTSDITG